VDKLFLNYFFGEDEPPRRQARQDRFKSGRQAGRKISVPAFLLS
jgi:hypothetical protein